MPRLSTLAFVFCWFFVSAHCFSIVAKDTEHIVKLGGLREVTAKITVSGDGYRVVVSMLPVKAFDPVTNNRLNRVKARAFALQALGKHLAAEKGASLVVKGLEVKEAAMDGRYFRLALLVPKLGYRSTKPDEAKPALKQGQKPTTGDEPRSVARKSKKPMEPSLRDGEKIQLPVASAESFLTRASDYLDTTGELRTTLAEDIELTEKSASENESFYAAIADLEERADRAFSSLSGQVKEDKLLLSMEQEQIGEELRKARAEVMSILKSAVARFDAKQDRAKKERKP